MEKPIQLSHVLFEFSPLDNTEEVDDKIQKNYLNLKQMISNKTAKECHEIYSKYVASNPAQNFEELIIGLLVAILVEQDNQQSKYYRDVVTISKDGLNVFTTYLNLIIIERLSKLKDHSVKQIFWITNQLIKGNYTSTENICSNLIRQAAGGDLSVKNLRLIEYLLDMLIENRNWIINSTTFLGPTVIYNFTRLVSDHMALAQNELRQKEVDFVTGLIREKFTDCMAIGRDFLRILFSVCAVPEFEKIWKDIYNNPKSLHHSFHSPLQLLSYRTPRRLFQSRLTFEMERKISFLATQVKFGNQKRYQDWFYKQYLATPESLSLRSDLVRYICCIIHPSNEVLCSDIIPRWAVIGWLLTTCSTTSSAFASKLALFFDWLLFDPKADNIMNIEPAILVMYYSVRSHPAVTSSLLDFLCRLPTTFSPALTENIKSGIKKSLMQILEKRVVQSLSGIFDSPNQTRPLKELVRETFPEFCSRDKLKDESYPAEATVTPEAPPSNLAAQGKRWEAFYPPDEPLAEKKQEQSTSLSSSSSLTSTSSPTSQPPLASTAPTSSTNREESQKAFSWPCSWNGTDKSNASYSHKQNHDKNRKLSTTCTGPNDSSKRPKVTYNDGGKNELSNNSLHKIFASSCLETDNDNDVFAQDDRQTLEVIYPFMMVPHVNFKEAISSFDETVRIILEDLQVQSGKEERCNLMDKLISAVFDNCEQQSNSFKELGHCIAFLYANDFSTRLFPSSSQSNESLEESITHPFFALCRSAFASPKASWNAKPISLLASVAKFFEPTGFLVLYFLRVKSVVNGTSVSTHYIEFCECAKRKLSKCLYDDLSMALTYDSQMFCFLLPSVFGDIAVSGSFPVTGNVDLIKLVVSAIDPISLQELICLCLTGAARIINKEEVLTLIEASLKWESWEQYSLWKLIAAQNTPPDNYITILPKLKTKDHAEAMSNILLNLQKVPDPSLEMIDQVFKCECTPNDPYVSSILRYWSMKTNVGEMARIIVYLCERALSPQMKRKGHAKTKSLTSLTYQCERILSHLDSIRVKSPRNKLLAQREILELFREVEPQCNDNQKERFADLFSNRSRISKKQKISPQPLADAGSRGLRCAPPT